MKRPLYYLLCAIACTSMVSATMPMAAIAEVIQPQAAAGQQAQADATASDTGKAEDGSNTNVPAANTATSNSTDTPANTTQTAPVDANTAGAAATPNTAAATGTTTPTPSLLAQTNPTPAAISTTPQTNYTHSATASQNGVTFTVSWNDAPAGTATTFHVTQTNGSSQAKARMDVPTYWDGGSHESVCDPSRPAWGSYYSLGTAGHDFTFNFTASGTYRIYFYFMDNDRYDPQNDKGIYYLRTTAEVTVNDAARPSVTQVVNNAVAQCRQLTNARNTTWRFGSTTGRSTSWSTTTASTGARPKAASRATKAPARATSASTPSSLTPRASPTAASPATATPGTP
ncbi:MAG TPA: hypothetical protein OIL77_00220 [Coriobacteriaceae bacterium]|nr:hypothetical protein [Coriobacteriaceae bacterium]